MNSRYLSNFGSDPQIMSEMAKRVEERPFDIMDINMGCPVPKVVKMVKDRH